MSANKLTTAAIALVLVLSAAVPAAAADGSASAGEEASKSITVTVTTTEDGTLVTFEQAGEAYSGATVDVEAVGDASYRGSGSYETDANGSIFLPAPEHDVAVRMDVETADARASGVVTLSAYHGVESETTVTIEAAAAGETSADGSAGADGDSNPANGDDEDRASASDDRSGEAGASADLDGDGHVSLGERLSSFVRSIARVELGGIGDAVSGFAIGNNPSDADDGAKAGADVNASADVEAGNGSVDVEAGSGGGETGIGVSLFGSSDADAGGSSEAGGDAESHDRSSAGGSGQASAETRANASATGSAEADAHASGRAEGSWFFGIFSWF